MLNRTIRNFRIVAPAILLSACATTNAPPPAVQIRTVTKTVEVQRPCSVTKPVRPAPLTKPIPTDAIALAAALALKLAEWSGPGGYGDRAASAIDTCAKP